MEKILKWIKCHKIRCSFILMIVYIAIPIAPFINSPIGIFTKDDAITFLSYYGTILGGVTGGLLTLLGVLWTINDNEKIRKQDLIAQYMPLINCEKYSAYDFNYKIDNIYEIVYSNDIDNTYDKDIKVTDILLKITNQSNGIAVLTDIKSDLKDISSKNNYMKYHGHNSSLEYKNTIIIPPLQSSYIKVKLLYSMKNATPNYISYHCNICYKSLYDEKIHETNINLTIRKQIDHFSIDNLSSSWKLNV